MLKYLLFDVSHSGLILLQRKYNLRNIVQRVREEIRIQIVMYFLELLFQDRHLVLQFFAALIDVLVMLRKRKVQFLMNRVHSVIRQNDVDLDSLLQLYFQCFYQLAQMLQLIYELGLV